MKVGVVSFAARSLYHHTDGISKWVNTSKMRKLVTRIKNFTS